MTVAKTLSTPTLHWARIGRARRFVRDHAACALGSMDATRPGSKWPGYVTAAVDKIRTQDPHAKIDTLFFDFTGFEQMLLKGSRQRRTCNVAHDGRRGGLVKPSESETLRESVGPGRHELRSCRHHQQESTRCCPLDKLRQYVQ